MHMVYTVLSYQLIPILKKRVHPILIFSRLESMILLGQRELTLSRMPLIGSTGFES